MKNKRITNIVLLFSAVWVISVAALSAEEPLFTGHYAGAAGTSLRPKPASWQVSHLLSSSYSSGSGGEFFDSGYLIGLSHLLSPALSFNLFLGYSLLQYNPVDEYGFGQQLGWDNFKGLSLIYRKKNLQFKFKYGEDQQDRLQRIGQPRLDLLSPLADSGMLRVSERERLDALTLEMQSSFLNDRITFKAAVYVPTLGLRRQTAAPEN
jgi:hypothetical protein